MNPLTVTNQLVALAQQAIQRVVADNLARKRGLLQWPWHGAFQEPFTLDLGLLSQECAALIRECPIFTPDLSDTLGTCTAVEPQQLIEQWAEQDPACVVDVGSHDSRSTSCR